MCQKKGCKISLYGHKQTGLEFMKEEKSLELLEKIWSQLKTISQVTLIINSLSRNVKQWTQKGKGIVITSRHENSITFQEEGQWQNRINYRNSFRWTWNRDKMMISLEHLRFGEKNPILLFHLIPFEKNLLKSINPHLCGNDTYHGSLHYNELFLKMHIRTIGPSKNEKADYIYT